MFSHHTRTSLGRKILEGAYFVFVFVVLYPLDLLKRRFATKKLDFEFLNSTTQINVRFKPAYKGTKTITDATTITKVVQKIQSYSYGWYSPLGDVPMGTIQCDFFADEKPIFGVAIGPDWLILFPLMRYLKKGEGIEIYRLLGIEDLP